MQMKIHQFLLALAILTLLLLFGHIPGYNKQLLIWGAAAGLLLLLCLVRNSRLSKLCRQLNKGAIPLAVAAVIIVTQWESWGKYRTPDFQPSSYASFGKVLIIVPHQDDDTNIAGGILSQLQEQGEVHVLFTTNGADTKRLKEAIDSLAVYGIPEQNVHCLGYPQCAEKYNGTAPIERSWGEEFEHLYNLSDNQLTTDYLHNTRTLSLPGMKGCTEGLECTRYNFKQNLSEAIQSIKPDTIVCIDYDIHPDHRATSLLFDECMAGIMKADSSYTPFILKAFAYSTAWTAAKDFYADNLLSTQNPYPTPYMQEVNCYNWADRLRLPVCKESLSRVLAGNKIRESFLEYASAVPNSPGMENCIVNADRVFWWRPTGNLLLNASITGSGSQLSHLNDFKLYDSDNITRFSQKPYNHGWLPESGQGEICVQLPAPSKIQQIRLYDHISPENQIQQLTIILSNGQEIRVTELPANGAALVIPTHCNTPLTGFRLRIEKACGANAGLAEIEAYSQAPTPRVKLVKLVDAQDNFMYDYTTSVDGQLRVSLYTYPHADIGEYKVFHTSQGEQHELQPAPDSGCFSLHQPLGSAGKLEVCAADGRVLDSARIQNPSQLVRRLRNMQAWVDESFLKNYSLSSQKRHFKQILKYYIGQLN